MSSLETYSHENADERERGQVGGNRFPKRVSIYVPPNAQNSGRNYERGLLSCLGNTAIHKERLNRAGDKRTKYPIGEVLTNTPQKTTKPYKKEPKNPHTHTHNQKKKKIKTKQKKKKLTNKHLTPTKPHSRTETTTSHPPNTLKEQTRRKKKKKKPPQIQPQENQPKKNIEKTTTRTPNKRKNKKDNKRKNNTKNKIGKKTPLAWGIIFLIPLWNDTETEG